MLSVLSSFETGDEHRRLPAEAVLVVANRAPGRRVGAAAVSEGELHHCPRVFRPGRYEADA